MNAIAAPVRRWGISDGAWLVGAVGALIACQIGLLAVGDTPLRLPMRAATYGVSLAMLLLFIPRGRAHPSWTAGLLALLIVSLGVLHPTTVSATAALATLALYAAVLAPLSWVAGLNPGHAQFRTALLLLWGFYVASAAVGILQVNFPGRFEPSLSAIIEEKGFDHAQGLMIELSGGERVFRPMGLTDQPGGAAIAGLYAIVLGLGLLVGRERPLLKALALAGMGAGVACIYLSHVRSILVMAGVAALVFAAALAWRQDWARLIRVGMAGAGAVAVATLWAFSVGGPQTIDRFLSLVREDPGQVYYRNRGRFLEHTIYVLLPEHPLGAGLGRWGMVDRYLGGDAPGREPLWAEIQWTAWLYDGGAPLMLVYGAALLAAIGVAARLSQRSSRPQVAYWAAALLAYNVAALAATFSAPLFAGQTGMEMWLLNAALFSAARKDG